MDAPDRVGCRGDLDSDSSAPELAASIPLSIAAAMALQRSTK